MSLVKRQEIGLNQKLMVVMLRKEIKFSFRFFETPTVKNIKINWLHRNSEIFIL